jgi:hypothetical protein
VAELKRNDEQLTTADLAGRAERPREPEARPQLVRNEQQRAEADPRAVQPAAQTHVRSESRPVLTHRPEQTVTGDEQRARNQMRPPTGTAVDHATPLFQETEVGDFRSRWSSIQAAFVDEPRKAVEDADNLVAMLMKKLAEGFANERGRLEGQWDRGDNVSTEDLRIALQRYRSFFDRLLKV